jgi:hypothetical protein
MCKVVIVKFAETAGAEVVVIIPVQLPQNDKQLHMCHIVAVADIIMKTTYADTPLAIKLLTAGTAGCVADFASFPLDTAKVRLQVSSYI